VVGRGIPLAVFAFLVVAFNHRRKAAEGIAARIESLAGMPSPEFDYDKAVMWCERRTGKFSRPANGRG
jgi:hypothetical protein